MSADTFYGSDFGALEAFDPEIAGVLVSELDRLRGGLQLIASENMSQPRGPHRARLDAVQQVRRGLPGAPLLRRLLRGRQGRDARHRAVQGAVRRRPRQRPAALGRQRQPGGLRRVHAARRHDPRDEPAAWRPPHPRHQGVVLRQVVQRRPLRRRQATPRTSTTTEVERLAKEHRPKVILAGGSAIPRLIDFEFFRAHRRRGRRDLLGRRRPLHRPRRRQGDPQPGPARRRRHLHDPQGAARPALRRDRLQGGARRHARQGGLPDDAGRPADAHDRRQGGQLQGVRDARVRRTTPRQVVANAAGPRRVAGRAGHPARRPAAPTPTCRCTTSRASWSPGPTPRPAATPPGSSSTRTPSRSTRRSPTSPRGIRVGTPCVTTQGMGDDEMRTHRRAHRHGGHRGRRRPRARRLPRGPRGCHRPRDALPGLPSPLSPADPTRGRP